MEVEKKVRKILKKEFCSNACELYSKCVEECLDQATTEVMAIMNKKEKSIKIFQGYVAKYAKKVVAFKKETKRLRKIEEVAKQLIGIKERYCQCVFDNRCSFCFTLEELEQVLKGK